MGFFSIMNSNDSEFFLRCCFSAYGSSRSDRRRMKMSLFSLVRDFWVMRVQMPKSWFERKVIVLGLSIPLNSYRKLSIFMNPCEKSPSKSSKHSYIIT